MTLKKKSSVQKQARKPQKRLGADRRQGELSGGPVSYYICEITRPNQLAEGYQAECSDIIEALGMNFNEGEAFKALWRKAAARTLGLAKTGNTPFYDAQKVEHYGKRIRIMEEA